MAKKETIAFEYPKGEYRVWPPMVRIKHGDDLEVANITGKAIEVRFGKDVMEDPDTGEPDPDAKMPVDNGHKGQRRVHAEAAIGAHEYLVVVKSKKGKRNKKAKGNSDPVMIVEN